MQQVRRSKFLRVGDDLMLLFGACSEAVDECQGPGHEQPVANVRFG